ncbi:MAG: response regulator transcription factor [Spirochaetaceae bacterium]
MARVYVVEDNELIRGAVQEYLEVSGYEVASFATIADTREAFAQRKPDVIILDVMLPDGSGFVFAKEIRREGNTPIIFLTAKEQESDRIMGFEVGGDDYVVKPFSNKELLLRIEALLKRVSSPKQEDKTISCTYTLNSGESRLEIDEKAHKVFLNGEELHLTSTEWSLLTYLAGRVDQAISRSALLGECLGYLYSGSERTVDTHIANLRAHLGEGEWIETIRGFGYRFAGVPLSEDLEE